MNHHTFCLPASAIEWHAILQLADALGLGYRGRIACTFDDRNRIWVTYSGEKSDIPNITAFHNDAGAGPQVPVPAFIVGMYRLAENRKASPPPEPLPPGVHRCGENAPEPQAGGIRGEEREMYVFTEGKWVSILHRITKLEERAMTNEGLNHLRAQVDALRGTVSNLETALDRHMINTRDGMQRIQKSIDATMRYERHAGETTSADPLKGTTAAGAGDQVTNDEQVRYVSRLRMCYEDSEVSIRKEASPKNIPFEVALAYLKAGRKVRRNQPTAPWSGHLHIDERGLLCHYDKVKGKDFSATIYPDWLTATDWEVIPEP